MLLLLQGRVDTRIVGSIDLSEQQEHETLGHNNHPGVVRYERGPATAVDNNAPELLIQQTHLESFQDMDEGNPNNEEKVGNDSPEDDPPQEDSEHMEDLPNIVWMDAMGKKESSVRVRAQGSRDIFEGFKAREGTIGAFRARTVGSVGGRAT